MKVLALFSLLSLVSCAIPAAGTRCEAGAAYCISSTSALQCQNGVLVAFTCLGPKGCTKGLAVPGGNPVLCDQSAGAVPGTPCAPEYEGHGRCVTPSSLLVCTKGAWVQLACSTGTSCHEDGGVACR